MKLFKESDKEEGQRGPQGGLSLRRSLRVQGHEGLPGFAGGLLLTWSPGCPGALPTARPSRAGPGEVMSLWQGLSGARPHPSLSPFLPLR